ncbi:hypothetical protein V2J09_017497 [Rumex salicifolius]
MATAILTICRALSPATAIVSHFDTRRLPLRLSIPRHLCFSDPPAVRFAGESVLRRSRRADSVVTRAGPTSNTLIFAFVFPLSLLAVTIFAAIRIGDRLDKKFLEELAMNQALREMDEEEEDETVLVVPKEEEPALPRARNRPKRQV